MIRVLAAALLVITPALANADVVDRSPAGFTVKTVVTIAASPERSFRALVDDIGRWWDASHTFSGDAGNLRLDARPGGCFCETLPKGGGVAHAVVINVVPGELLRVTGALGPLQEHAVIGTLTLQFAAAGQGTTATLTYSVAGSFPGGLEKVAPAVDKVLGDQLQRLKAYVDAAQRPTSAQGSIDPERMTAHVKVLASDEFEGRGPATPGETKTVEYIVKQFEALGVKPGGPPDGRGGRAWTQDVPLAQADAGPVTASVTVGGMNRPLRQGDDIAIRATHLPTSRVTVANAPLVFVGYGVSAPERKWDDFKGVDLRGKIALVLINDPDFEADLRGRFDGKAMTYYGRWTYKYEEAARRGALGMLVIHETDPASYGWATVKNSNTATMIDIVRPDPAAVHPAVEGWIQRDITVALFKSAGLDFEAEKKKAQRADFKPVALRDASFSLDYTVKQARIVSKNIVARIDGRTRPDETVIYTAHWDHLGVGAPDAGGDRIYNGARDNALGIASLLEIARLSAAAPPADRSVVFLALTAEEKGLLGSEYYAQQPLYPLEKTVAVYNMDGGSTWGPSNDVAIAGEGKISLQRDLAMAARLKGREFSPDPRPEAGAFFRSDHFPFAKVGVPAISFRNGQDLEQGGVAAGKAASDEYNERRYHQPGDEWSPDWDLTGAAQDTELLYTIGRDMANSRRWPEWEEGSEFKAIRDKTAAARR